MSRRTKEQERNRKREQRSRARNGRRIINGLAIEDENILREALEDEGNYVGLNFVFAIKQHLDSFCQEYKKKKNEEIWASISHIPDARIGTLERLGSSDEPLQAPKNPREHHEFVEDWAGLLQALKASEDPSLETRVSVEQLEYYDDELRDRADAEENDALETEERAALEAWFNRETGFHRGESRQVKPHPNLDRIERGQRPVPSPTSKKPKK